MHRMSRDRFNAWQDLDALVGAELDALQRRQPAPAEEPPTDGFEEESFDETDDEEAFIERTAAWLRSRADADALLDAIRTALDNVAEEPSETPSPDMAPSEPPSENDGER
jgi:hypothetical protein